MDHPTPLLLAEKIVFRDLNSGLDPAHRLAGLEKLSRFAARHPEIIRVAVEIQRDRSDSPDHGKAVAKGELAFGGPALLASVSSADGASALDYLLEKFERQLRRHRLAIRSRAPVALAS